MIGYLAESLTGAWRLARLKPDGFAWFDLSADGFWRSFLAMPVAAPLFLGFVAAQAGGGPLDAGTLVVQLLSYLVVWCLFLGLMVPFARFFGLGPGYVPFVVAYNWAQVLMLMLFLPLTLLRAAGVMPGLMNVVIVLLMAFGMVYVGVLARFGLRADWPQTVAVVLIEMVTSYAIPELVDAIF